MRRPAAAEETMTAAFLLPRRRSAAMQAAAKITGEKKRTVIRVEITWRSSPHGLVLAEEFKGDVRGSPFKVEADDLPRVLAGGREGGSYKEDRAPKIEGGRFVRHDAPEAEEGSLVGEIFKPGLHLP